MPEIKYDPNKEDVVIIRNPADEAPTAGRRRGPLRAGWPEDPFRRRKKPSDENVRVKIYDMGRTAGGADSSYSQYADPVVVTPWDGSYFPGTFLHVWNPSIAFGADFLSSFNAAFVSDMDGWAGQYHRILEPMKQYGLKLNGIQVTDDGSGIELAASSSIEVQSPLAFNFFGSDGVKVTSVPDYSAAAVSFALDKDCDLYIAPRIALMHGRGVRIRISGSGDFQLPRYDFLLNYIYRAMPRSFFLTNSLWSTVIAHFGDTRTYLFEAPYSANSQLSAPSGLTGLPTYPDGVAAMNSFRALFINDSNARNRRIKTKLNPPSGPSVYIAADIPVPTTDFLSSNTDVAPAPIIDPPDSVSTTQNGPHTPGWFDYPMCRFSTAIKQEGLLLGGAKKVTGQKYYFWQPVTESAGTGQILWSISV